METERAVCQFGICLTTINVGERLISFFCSSSIWWGEFSIIFLSLLQSWTEILSWKALCQLCWSLKIQNEIKVHLVASYLFAINPYIICHPFSYFLFKKCREISDTNLQVILFLCNAIYRALLLKVYKYINDIEKENRWCLLSCSSKVKTVWKWIHESLHFALTLLFPWNCTLVP